MRKARHGDSPRGFTVAELLVSLTVILLLAVVVPALIATSVARMRIARAESDVRRIAEGLKHSGPEASLWTSSGKARVDVLAGMGNVPILPANSRWAGRSEDLAHMGLEGTTDPWGNRYMVNVGALSGLPHGDAAAGVGRAVWVLSAGPNGIVETPFDQPADRAKLSGDDIGFRVR
jgi:prepilin-type N-terminal cleavage/methylation domain-containing protein